VANGSEADQLKGTWRGNGWQTTAHPAIIAGQAYLLHPMALALAAVNKKAQAALAVLFEPPKRLCKPRANRH
jgi:hypothetical protein